MKNDTIKKICIPHVFILQIYKHDKFHFGYRIRIPFKIIYIQHDKRKKRFNINYSRNVKDIRRTKEWLKKQLKLFNK